MIDTINQRKKIVIRFIGTSKDSYNIQSILHSIIEDLSIEYNLSINKNQLSFDRIFDYFKTFILNIAYLNKDVMFYFILDSLDQLQKENDARKLGWLPVKVPSNIRFIVSTLSEDEYEAYPILFSIFASTPQRQNFILVSDLTEDNLNSLIEKRLDSIQNYALKVKVNDFLNLNLKNKRKHCLYIKLILDESLKWTIFTDYDDLVIATTAEYAIEYLFEKIEKNFKKDFIEISLRYLTLSRKGIYFDDWVKLLSKMFPNPHFVLLQLVNELKQYLLGPLYRWYHRKFIEIANMRYCSNKNGECKYAHKLVVDTFTDDIYVENDKHWINELPFHAICSKDIEIVKAKFLLNIQFMKVKIDLVGLDELISDYTIAEKILNDSSLKIIYNCLIASSDIRNNSNNLTSSLLGRVPRNFAELAWFIDECILLPERVVIPNKKYLSFEMNESTINLHNKQIIYLNLTNNRQHLIINTIDKIIKVFTINGLKFNETERYTFERAFINTNILLISNDDKVIYAVGIQKLKKELEFEENGIIEAFSLAEKERKFSIKSLSDEFVEHYSFAVLNTYLLILTHKLCYKVDYLTGVILEFIKLPYEWPDTFSFVQAQNNLILASYTESSKFLVGNNSKLILYDFEQYSIRGYPIFIPQNSNVLIPMIKHFRNKFNDRKMVWELIEFNLNKLEIIKKIKINTSLDLLDVSYDGNIVYGSCYNFIYCLDIKNEALIYAVQHCAPNAPIVKFVMLDENTLINLSKSNNICMYDVENRNYKNEDYNPFNIFNSREIKVMMDDFSSRCPLLLVYNIFEKNENEMYLLYDLKNEKIIKEFPLYEKSGDLKTLCLISAKAIFVESFKLKAYCLISIKNFEIVKEIKFCEKKIFKRISYNKFLISYYTGELLMFEIDHDEFSDKIYCIPLYRIICNLVDLDWFSANQTNFIYKLKHSEKIHVFDFTTKEIEIFKFDFDVNIQASYQSSSPNGKYLIIYDSSKISILNLQTKLLQHEISINLKKIEKLFFVDSLLTLILSSENNGSEVLCFINPENNFVNFEKCLCFDNKKSKLNYVNNFYRILKHSDSNYIWIQTLLYSELKSKLVVFDINDLSKVVCSLDTEYKLRNGEVILLGKGNYLLAKEFEKIKFVIFYMKEEKMYSTNFIEDLFDELKF